MPLPALLLGRCRGAALDRQKLRHPFLDRDVIIVLGDHVTVAVSPYDLTKGRIVFRHK